MLLQLDPDKMAQLGLTVSDVAAAVREQNATNPAGRLGAEPSPPGTQLTLPITTIGRLQTPDEFNDIVIRARPDGSDRFGCATSGARCSARAATTSRDASTACRRRSCCCTRGPGANALAVKQAVVKRLDEMQSGFPQGVHWAMPFDTTPFVSASIHEVAITLVEAMILVTLVVFLFLQSWRATLIPMLAVPVSVIGTFLGLLAFGMSINVLTLFGLVLAIGIVVDDAIVVIENVERIMASEGLDAAARRGQGDSPGGQRARRDRARALLGVRAGGVHRRRDGRAVQAVRDDDRHRRRAVGRRRADADAGALRAAAHRIGTTTHTTGFFGWFNRLFARATRRVRRRGGLGDSAGRRSGSPCFSSSSDSPELFWRKHPDGVHPDGRQGIHGAVGAAARRRVASADRGDGREDRKDHPRRAGGE